MEFRKPIHNVIILVVETEFLYQKPEKIASHYLNRFVIEEDASFEILGIYHLKLNSE